MPKVKLIGHGLNTIRHIKKHQAERFIATGLADAYEQPGDSRPCIRLRAGVRFEQNLIVPNFWPRPGESDQGKVYEKAGIEKHPTFFNGGLTRTEHRPAPIRKFQGARVGHQ